MPLPLPAPAGAAVRWYASRSLLAQDGTLAAAMAAIALLPGLSGTGVLLGAVPERDLDAVGVTLVVAQCLALSLRRRAPVVCLVVVATTFGAHRLLGYPPSVAGIAVFLALYSAGAHLLERRTSTAVLATAGFVGLAIAFGERGPTERPLEFLTFYLVLAGCWIAGSVVRSRALGEAERQRLTAERAVAVERGHIAAELHDVVTHHVTAMVVQADATQYLLAADPGRAGDGLAAIGDTGRRALEELRTLLDLLDPVRDEPAGPAAGWQQGRAPVPARVRDLVDQVRAAGQPVELREVGTPRTVLGASELAAHRVVQEALTNALKHAPGCRTVVSVRTGDEAIDVSVTTAAPNGRSAPPAPRPAGTGRGLVGLRARVASVGGRLEADADADGGFTVTAHLPAGGPR